MLEAVLGSLNCERVLMFLLKRDEGYAKEIADFYQSALSPIQKQLDKLELGGVLVSSKAGRTRMYRFNPRYPLLKELKAFLEKAFVYYPESIQNTLKKGRTRPRRSGKPL